MNEEEFLKEHPGLKGKFTCDRKISATIINETQLDKQKVKEAWDKIVHRARKGFMIVQSDIDDFEKELRLE